MRPLWASKAPLKVTKGLTHELASSKAYRSYSSTSKLEELCTELDCARPQNGLHVKDPSGVSILESSPLHLSFSRIVRDGRCLRCLLKLDPSSPLIGFSNAYTQGGCVVTMKRLNGGILIRTMSINFLLAPFIIDASFYMQAQLCKLSSINLLD